MKLEAVVATVYEDLGYYNNDGSGSQTFAWIDSGRSMVCASWSTSASCLLYNSKKQTQLFYS